MPYIADTPDLAEEEIRWMKKCLSGPYVTVSPARQMGKEVTSEFRRDLNDLLVRYNASMVVTDYGLEVHFKLVTGGEASFIFPDDVVRPQ